MDKFLLIVEAKKNNRDVIKRGYGKLVTERNNVAVVVNKARSYVPKLLDAESSQDAFVTEAVRCQFLKGIAQIPSVLAATINAAAENREILCYVIEFITA